MKAPPQSETRGLATAAVTTVLAGWVLAILGSTPPRPMQRVRATALSKALLPDLWYSTPFAAAPDVVLVFRVERADGTTTAWEFATPAVSRTWRHVVWFPQRRSIKALHDLVTELLADVAGRADNGVVGPLLQRQHSYRTLEAFTAAILSNRFSGGAEAPKGFQFAVIRNTCHQADEPQCVIVSSFVPLRSRVRA